jgi:hypothetical protein
MMQTLWAVIQDGKIVLSEPASLPEGARALVTLLDDDDRKFVEGLSGEVLAEIWNNKEDDVYAELLKK